MKRLIINSDVKEIHIDSLDEYSLITVQKRGKTIGLIMRDNNDNNWICGLLKDTFHSNPSLSAILEEDDLNGCEFYVLD